MRAASASIQVLRPGAHWRIAVPDAYFPKYLFVLFLLLVIFFGHWPVAVFYAYFPKYVVLSSYPLINTSFSVKVIIINCFWTHSEWYQQYARAGSKLVATQRHMVMWSVDTLPQLFEVITENLFCLFLVFHNSNIHDPDTLNQISHPSFMVMWSVATLPYLLEHVEPLHETDE